MSTATSPPAISAAAVAMGKTRRGMRFAAAEAPVGDETDDSVSSANARSCAD